jgi:hypothetical protein
VIDDSRFNPAEFEQLALGMEIDEDPEVGDGISAEERMRRSENARVAMETHLHDHLEETEAASKKRIENGGQPGEEDSGWSEDYFTLRDAGFPWRVAAYIAWAASPKRSRWPKTQDELAEKVLGLNSDRQITTWRKKNPRIDDVIGLMQAKSLLDHRRDVFKALIESASRADHRSHQDRKLFLEMTGDYTPRIKVEDVRKQVDPVEMNEADLAEIEKVKKG